jgi:hypothetical protein
MNVVIYEAVAYSSLCCISMQEHWRREGILFISKLIQIPKGNSQNLFIFPLQINMVMKKNSIYCANEPFSVPADISTLRFCYQRSGGSNTIWIPELILLSSNDIMNKVPDCRRSCAVNSFCFSITILTLMPWCITSTGLCQIQCSFPHLKRSLSIWGHCSASFPCDI